MGLINHLIDSFHVETGKGMPLGNVTSQLFSNIYMNPFDQFIKRELRVPYYLRYADDFVIMGTERMYLEILIPKIAKFLEENLVILLHPRKLKIRKWSQGIDFLGYISLPRHTLVRTKTKRRMLKKMAERQLEFEAGTIGKYALNQSAQSYLGILKHCRGYSTEKKIMDATRK